MSVNSNALHSFVDESMRQDKGLYLMAAVVADPDECDSVRDDLRKLLKGRQKRLHWRDEDAPRQRKIATAVGKITLSSVVVIGAPMDPKRQERARRVCMERLYMELWELGVGSIFQEQRTPSLNKHDHKMRDALRSQKAIPDELRVEFAQPNEEPMLWIPDAVAGAVGQSRAGVNDYLELMVHTVREIDITLR
ncbi:hypothetical protein ACFQ46_10670 [Kineococcus sp. GCM10028916]|uniref:hypothetical protein n=1 Tax=Kineococcus sp. GCM10028916 TaxID=3273394 RepID=UPI00363ECAFB